MNGFQAKLRELGATCENFDALNGWDLLDENLFNDLKRRAETEDLAGLLLSTPCETFSCAGNGCDGGSKPLRLAWGPELYMRKGLTAQERLQVQEDTLLSQRAIELVRIALQRGIPWVHTSLLERQDQPSVYHLDEWQRIQSAKGVVRRDIVQGASGSPAAKPSMLMACKVDLNDFPDGFPDQTNRMLAQALYEAHLLEKSSQPNPGSVDPVLRVVDGIVREAPLRQVQPHEKAIRHQQDAQAIGGMRDPAKAVSKLAGLQRVGSKIRAIVDAFLQEYPETTSAALSHIGKKMEQKLPFVDVLRKRLEDAFEADQVSAAEEGYTTSLNHKLLRAMAVAAQDPDVMAADWLAFGAPAGIQIPIQDPGGIFPTSSNAYEEVLDSKELLEDEQGFYNYQSVDDLEAEKLIQDFMASGYVQVFDNVSKAETFCGGKPVLSKLAMLVKEKRDEAGNLLRTKRRLILDCLRSNVNASALLRQRLLLPRLQDAVNSVLDLQAWGLKHDRWTSTQVELLVIDIKDAFWQVPLHQRERRFFCAKYKDKYLVYLQIAQGSRNAPLIWARIASLLARLTAGTFKKGEAALQLYVDDPLLAVRGTVPERDRVFAGFIYFWCALGVGFAFDKAARGHELQWVGATCCCNHDGVRISVKPDTISELKCLTHQFLSKNVVPIKALRSFAGKCSHVASMIPTWKPFLGCLWAALASSDDSASTSRAPKNTVWTQQIRHALDWIQAFVMQHEGTLCRTYLLRAYCRTGVKVRIIFDASPFGLGAYLMLDHRIVSWFADDITADDQRLFGFPKGDHRGQQAWEALCLLVALRLWKHHWRTVRVTLETTGDSISALTMMSTFTARGHTTNLVARELALEMADLSFWPDVISHIPGMSNRIADILSRKHEPGTSWQLPRQLRGVAEARPPKRREDFCRSYRSPRSN